MDKPEERSAPARDGRRPAGYEPPRVETVLTPAELEHEILYAGAVDGTPVGT